mmetsp:Transcript_408/g.1417  ORF Transcript_408/g.1417 Transcript_408/m.1417 type:complete len:408 (-) Transcript_408:56-1279(-)
MAGAVRFLCLALLVACVIAGDASILLKNAGVFEGSVVHEQDVSNLISHVARMPSQKRFDINKEFPVVDVFEARPEANIFVVVDGVSADDVSGLEFFTSGSSAELLSANRDTVSTVASMLTGSPSTVHGIHAAQWPSAKGSVEAFTKAGQCLVQSLPDTLSLQSEGEATTFAIAGSHQLAVALGIHPQVLLQQPSFQHNAAIAVEDAEVFSIFEDTHTAAPELNAVKSRLVGVVSAPNVRQAVAEELYAIEQAPELFAARKSSGTSVADYIAVGLTSPRAVAATYGRESKQYRDVLGLLDASLTHMYASIDAMYAGRTVGQVALLGTEEKVTGGHTLRATMDFINGTAVNDLNLTANEVSQFQAFIWVAVFFIAAVLFGFCLMHKMDVDYDSIVFRTVDGPREIPDVK